MCRGAYVGLLIFLIVSKSLGDLFLPRSISLHNLLKMCISCDATGAPCSSCRDSGNGDGFQLCDECVFLTVKANVSSLSMRVLLGDYQANHSFFLRLSVA